MIKIFLQLVARILIFSFQKEKVLLSKEPAFAALLTQVKKKKRRHLATYRTAGYATNNIPEI